MNKYYIKDEDGTFWCENNFGYWSRFDDSLKHRFEGIFLWVLPLYLIMKLCGIKCKMIKIKNKNSGCPKCGCIELNQYVKEGKLECRQCGYKFDIENE